VEGCLEWQRVGLDPPDAVVAATSEYFKSQDAVGQWLEERCEIGQNYKETSADLFTDWKSWCELGNGVAGTTTRFGENLKARGFAGSRSGKARGFAGLRLIGRVATAPPLSS